MLAKLLAVVWTTNMD